MALLIRRTHGVGSVLAAGRLGMDLDTGRVYAGDGSTNHRQALYDETYIGAARAAEISYTTDLEADLSALELLDTLAQGDLVGTWPDPINALDANQTGSARPKFCIGGGPNGLPGVYFDGTDDYLDFGDISANFPSAGSLFMVVTMVGDTGYSLFSHDGAGDSWWRWTDGNTYCGMWRSARTAAIGAGMPTTGTHLISVHSSASRWKMYLDEIEVASAAAAYSDGDNYHLGSGAGYFNGYVNHVRMYSADVTGSDFTSVNNDFRAKWRF